MMDGDDISGEFNQQGQYALADLTFLDAGPDEIRFAMPFKPGFEKGDYKDPEDQFAAMGVRGLFTYDYMVVTKVSGSQSPILRPLLMFESDEFSDALAEPEIYSTPYIAKVVGRDTDEEQGRCVFTLKRAPNATFAFTQRPAAPGPWKGLTQ